MFTQLLYKKMGLELLQKRSTCDNAIGRRKGCEQCFSRRPIRQSLRFAEMLHKRSSLDGTVVDHTARQTSNERKR